MLLRREFLSMSASAATAVPFLQTFANAQEPERAAAIPVRTEQQAAGTPLKFQDVRNQIAFDRYGLIIQRDGNGGDTAAREGMYWLARAARDNFGFYNAPGKPKLKPFQAWRTRADFVKVLDLLEEKDSSGKFTGRYRRHPYDKEWSSPDKMSRDNMLPLIAAMGAYGGQDMSDRLDRFYTNLDKKLWIFNAINADLLLMFEQFIKRARNQAVDETIDHVIADCAVSSRLRCIKDMDDVGDDMNQMVTLLLPEMRQIKDYFPAIRKRYVDLRPMSYGVYMTDYYMYWGHAPVADVSKMRQRMDEGIATKGWKPDCSNAFGAIKWYCRRESQGNPGLANLYRPLYDRSFGGPVSSAGMPFKKVDDLKECTVYKLLPDSICGQEQH